MDFQSFLKKSNNAMISKDSEELLSNRKVERIPKMEIEYEK